MAKSSLFENKTEICICHRKTNAGHYLCRVGLNNWNLKDMASTNRLLCLKTTTNTCDIEKILRSDILVHRVGNCEVLPRDKLLFFTDRTKAVCFVIITDPSDSPGDNFLAPIIMGLGNILIYSVYLYNILILLISLREARRVLISIIRGYYSTLLVLRAAYMLLISC